MREMGKGKRGRQILVVDRGVVLSFKRRKLT